MTRAVPTALALIGLVAACSSNDSAAQSQGGGPPPAPVEIGPVEDGSLTSGWRFLGRVQPAMEAEVAAAVSGHVLKVTVREGDRTKRNQVLVALDAADARAQLDAAKARLSGLETELEQAKRQLARVEQLDFPTISEPEKEKFALAVDTQRAAVATQSAEVKRLQVQLSQHTVRAPFDGAVRARHIDPGDWVNVGNPLVELVSLDDVEVHVDVSADVGAKLAVGQRASLIGSTPAPAIIKGVVPALDSDTRTMRIRLAPESPPAWLVAGMAVDVEFEVELGGEGVLVSRDAVIRGPVSSRVIKVVDGKGVPVTVQVIATAEDRALVRGDGLAAGDRVVVRGNERLRPGQPLRVKE